MFECSEWHCRQIWPWTRTSTSLMSAQLVFIGCGNCDMSGGHWTRSQWQCSSMPSSRPASTTVTFSHRTHRRLRLTSYNVCWMWQHKQVWLWSVDLHCLDMLGRVKFKLVSMVHNGLHHRAPRYLMDCCIPVSEVASRRHFCSARRHYLVVPRHNLSSYGRRAFAVAGPAAWNSLSDDLHDPTLSTDCFRRLLKTHLFSEYRTSTYNALEVSHFMCYTNLQRTYLLTYLLTMFRILSRSHTSQFYNSITKLNID